MTKQKQSFKSFTEIIQKSLLLQLFNGKLFSWIHTCDCENDSQVFRLNCISTAGQILLQVIENCLT